LKTVIKIEHLSKYYRLGVSGTGMLVHDLNRWWLLKSGQEDKYLKIDQKKKNDFWALKDINLEIYEGDILAILGRNGAGKSTLLKILSKVTTPTKGIIKIKGKLSSLLEVGTGFHPELSGRENIFLNGAILGMSNAEIKSKLDEIIAFASVEKFVDTPVKRYSSGMYVRLAFAVAAHLTADILIVDEVLAVGDSEFQKKCLGKMKEVGNNGKTVIFVTHNLTAAKFLCNKGLVLSEGALYQPITDANNAVAIYSNTLNSYNNNFDAALIKNRIGNGKALVSQVLFIENGIQTQKPETGKSLLIRICVFAEVQLVNCTFAMSFSTLEGDNKIFLSSDLLNKSFTLNKGENKLQCELMKNPLQPGKYVINMFLKDDKDIIDWTQEAFTVEVNDGDFYGTGKTINNGNNSVLIDQIWTSC
jgi:lipopolysaccharide transport system ATP-binding protein